MPNSELGALTYIVALTQAGDPRVTSKRVVFPTIPFEPSRNMRIELLSSPDFMASLVATNESLRASRGQGQCIPGADGLSTVENPGATSNNHKRVVAERKLFIESWIPVAIALIYKDPQFGKVLDYLVRTKNHQEVEDLFGRVMMTLAESVSVFDWQECSDAKILHHQFINYLKSALRDCLKIDGHSKLHTFSTSFSEGGTIFRAGSDTPASALALVQEWEIKETLSPKAQEVWELLQEGYCFSEIMLQLGISRAVFRRYKQEIDSATRAVCELPLVTGGVHNRSFNRDVIEELRGAYGQRRDLLAPVEKKFADAVFACPPDGDLYHYVTEAVGTSRDRFPAIWYAIKKTLQDYKLDSNRHGRRGRKGPELSKIRLVRKRFLEEINTNPTLKIRMDILLNPTHRSVIQLALEDPTLRVNAIARTLGISRYVVTNAFDRVEGLFPEVHARLTALV